MVRLSKLARHTCPAELRIEGSKHVCRCVIGGTGHIPRYGQPSLGQHTCHCGAYWTDSEQTRAGNPRPIRVR